VTDHHRTPVRVSVAGITQSAAYPAKSIKKWLKAEAKWRAEEADRADRWEQDLRSIVGGARTAAKVDAALASEAETPGGIREMISGIEDEAKRRDAIRALQRMSRDLREAAEAWRDAHTHTGVPDEVECSGRQSRTSTRPSGLSASSPRWQVTDGDD
jgi:hypothetical protein